MKILHLTLKKKWFDLIASGEKKHEYREDKPYWKTRLVGKEFDIIRFRNGYSKDSPVMDVEFRGICFTPAESFAPEHGEKLEGDIIVISLGKVLRLSNSM